MQSTEELLIELRKRFPEVSESSLASSLELSGYDLDRAIKVIEEKYYSDDAAIPAATPFWSSVFGGDGDGESNGENDWATSLRSLTNGVEQVLSTVEEAVETLGGSLAAVVQDVGDFVFGLDDDENTLDVYQNKEEEVVTAASRSMKVKRRGTAGGAGFVQPNQDVRVDASDEMEDENEWNDKLD